MTGDPLKEERLCCRCREYDSALGEGVIIDLQERSEWYVHAFRSLNHAPPSHPPPSLMRLLRVMSAHHCMSRHHKLCLLGWRVRGRCRSVNSFESGDDDEATMIQALVLALPPFPTAPPPQPLPPHTYTPLIVDLLHLAQACVLRCTPRWQQDARGPARTLPGRIY